MIVIKLLKNSMSNIQVAGKEVSSSQIESLEVESLHESFGQMVCNTSVDRGKFGKEDIGQVCREDKYGYLP